ncbi:hypothetical protein DEO72_LG7g2379 [Vigna unguiculata]|uniref:Uncharacterized protein n=1 Tax=Vigna unguiculata TaxID=3917 RepID=A0A4D6MM62_VIGUN|nr:hypothetical protein DEO72_LG7g2379 [Vigna unguiculata]
MQNNQLTSISGSTNLPPNVTLWLEGNPMCPNNNTLVQVCGSKSDSSINGNFSVSCPVKGCPPSYEYNVDSYPSEYMEKFLTLALKCCKDAPDERPKMAEVARELENMCSMLPETNAVEAEHGTSGYGRIISSSQPSSSTRRTPFVSEDVSVQLISNLILDASDIYRSLRNCNLQGPIPDLSTIPQLTYVDMQNNQLTSISGSTNLPPNVTLWLEGNPMCPNNNTLVQVCGSKSDSSINGNFSVSCPVKGCPPSYEYNVDSYPSEYMEKFLTLALKCCKDAPDERPKMAEVARELENMCSMLPETNAVEAEHGTSGYGRIISSSQPSSSTRRTPFVSEDVSGSDLISGKIPTIRPR